MTKKNVCDLLVVLVKVFDENVYFPGDTVERGSVHLYVSVVVFDLKYMQYFISLYSKKSF